MATGDRIKVEPRGDSPELAFRTICGRLSSPHSGDRPLDAVLNQGQFDEPVEVVYAGSATADAVPLD